MCTRVVNILIGKGYIELEETLLQWKQKSHLMERLQVSYFCYDRLAMSGPQRAYCSLF